MQTPLFAFCRRHWQWVRWVLLVLAIVLAGLLLTQGTDYATAWYQRRHLHSAQAQATTAHARQQATSAARYQRYQLDSTRLATHKHFLLEELTHLQHLDDSLTRLRPARVPLPADPPRE
jgi:hypothetical protein